MEENNKYLREQPTFVRFKRQTKTETTEESLSRRKDTPKEGEVVDSRSRGCEVIQEKQVEEKESYNMRKVVQGYFKIKGCRKQNEVQEVKSLPWFPCAQIE